MGKRFNKFRKSIRHPIKELKEKLYYRHMKRTTMALVLTIPYLLSEWSARAYNLYLYFPPIDVLIHFLFGTTFASIATLIYYKKKQFIFFWVLVVSVVWEIIEITGDKLVAQPLYLQDKFFYDGIGDIIFAMFGALVAAYFLGKSLKKGYFR